MKKISPKTRCTILAIIMATLTLGIAITINESYKAGHGYITLWQPADTLAFYGSYLSFVGIVVLGCCSCLPKQKGSRP